MAVLINDTSSIVTYTASAGQTAFAVPFEFFAVTDLVVERNGVALAYNASPANNSQYSVTGANVEGGGAIALGAPGAVLGDRIVIYRNLPLNRRANYPETGPFDVRAVNTELARYMAIMQQLRDREARVLEYASPEDFTGTDTARFNAALATGKPVVCRSASYAITGTLTPTVAGQIIDLNGALITATGSFDLFSVTGLQGVIICNGRIEAAAMTGGNIFSIVNADRVTIENLLIFNPFNLLFVQKCNVVELRNTWANNIRGAYGIRWFGNASNRSDVLRLIGTIMSFPDSGIGIDWDGNCHTLQAFGAIIVRPNKGLVIRNTAGATAPEFGFLTNLEIDFPVSHGVEILAGESYYFGPQFYCHGSTTGSGVFVAAGLAPDRIHFAGGKISGNTRYGIENNTRVMLANLVLTGNVIGNLLSNDAAILSAPRLELDPTYLMRRDGSGNPILQFDANDFFGFNRSANDLFATLGGTTRFQVSALNDAVSIMVNNALKQVTQGAADSGGTGFRVLRVPN